MSNMQFWDDNKKTDPTRVKAITGKQYSGNSPQPYYMVERATKAFGMCGIGWGLNIISERMERLTECDVLHIAVVEFWYIHDEKRGSITQIGQTKACYKTAKGALLVDEDAPKKSVTDALTKCMSYLGFAGDIFSGQWDDSKYVQSITKEFAKAKQGAQGNPSVPNPPLGLNVAAPAALLPSCDPVKFAELLPQWKKLIAEGTKTADAIIENLSKKYTLTEDQKTKIKAEKIEVAEVAE